MVQGAVEAALVAGFEASDMVEDAGAVGEMAEGGAEVVVGIFVDVRKQFADAGGEDFEFGDAGALKAPEGGDDLFDQCGFAGGARAEVGEKFLAEGDEGGLRFGGEDGGGGV